MASKAVVISCVNQKGGTAKSVTTENLGIGLAMEGKKVLLVDTDPQASLTISLGYPRPDDLPVTLTDIMKKVISDEPIEPGEGILHHEESIDLMPANIELSGLEVSLVNTISRETVLKQYLQPLRKEYDFILIDCSPSLGMLTVNAMAASDNLIVPVPGAGILPVSKRTGAPAPDSEPGEKADQSKATDRRDTSHDGGGQDE